jgi:hypothetical protein
MTEQQQYRQVDKFDRMMGALAGLPDVAETKPSTVVALTPLIGETQTFILQTKRQKEVGDWIFIQYVDSEGSKRLFLPPEAAAVVARQYDALGKKNRKAAARLEAARRKAAGIKPGFLKKKVKS